MSEQSPVSVSSRELAQYLFALADMQRASGASFRLLAAEETSHVAALFDEQAKELDKLAWWLDDAKFEVRDPFSLHQAVAGLLRDATDVPGNCTVAFVSVSAISALKAAFDPFRGTLFR